MAATLDAFGPPPGVIADLAEVDAVGEAPGDLVVFAKGDWQQAPRSYSGPDLIEEG